MFKIPKFDLTNDMIYFERRAVIFQAYNDAVKQASLHLVRVRRKLSLEKAKMIDVLRATRRATQRTYRYTSQYHLRRFRNHDFEGCSCSSCREWLRFNLHKFEYSNFKEELANKTEIPRSIDLIRNHAYI